MSERAGSSGEREGEGGRPPEDGRGDSQYFSSLGESELRSVSLDGSTAQQHRPHDGHGAGMGGGGGAGGDGGGPDDPNWPRDVPKIPGLNILRRAGAGGQGLVFEAVVVQSLKRVAVKVPKPGPGLAMRADALRKEALQLGRLSHDNIIQMFWSGEDGWFQGAKCPYLILQLVEDAKTIKEFANTRGLDVRNRVEMVVQVASAVQHMHDLRVYHRDLKPGNILVNSQGKPYIIDVGLAATGNRREELDERGFAVGTYAYMAPEQFDGDQLTLSGRTDVYALGMILFEVLTGELPLKFDDLHDRAAVERVVRNQRPRLLKDAIPLGPELEDLSVVIDVALRKSNAAQGEEVRCATPGILADHLRNVLKTGRANTELGGSKVVAPVVSKGDETSKSSQSTTTIRIDDDPESKEPLRRLARQTIVRVVVWCVAVLVGGLCGRPLADETGMAGRFERSAIRSVPPAVRGVPIESVRVIRFKDEQEPIKTVEWLRSNGNPYAEFDPRRASTFRGVMAALLRKLAGAGVKVVAMDTVFQEDSTYDEEFCRAAAALRATTPLVVAQDTNLANSGASPSKKLGGCVDDQGGNYLIAGAGPGAATTSESAPSPLDPSVDVDNDFWKVTVINSRPGRNPWAGLSATVVARGAIRSPQVLYEVDSNGRGCTATGQSGGSGITFASGAPVPMPLTETRPASDVTEDEVELTGVRRGDLEGLAWIAMPESQEMEQVTWGTLEVLRASNEDVGRWFGEKYVFVGSTVYARMDPAKDPVDHFAYADGRRIWGVYAQDMAVEAMLKGRFLVRLASAPQTWGACGLAAAAPLAAGWIWRRGRRRTAALLTAAAGTTLVVVTSWVVLRYSLWCLLPYAPVVACAVAGVLACLIKDPPEQTA